MINPLKNTSRNMSHAMNSMDIEIVADIEVFVKSEQTRKEKVNGEGEENLV